MPDRPGRDPCLRRAGRKLPRRARRLPRPRRPHPVRDQPPGGRRGLHGRGPRQAHRAPRRLFRDPRARAPPMRRSACTPRFRTPRPWCCSSATWPATRATARPFRRWTTVVLRPQHQGHGQARGAHRRRAPHSRIRGARLCHRHERPARPGGAGAARRHADADRGRRSPCRAWSRCRPGATRARCASCARCCWRASVRW